MTIASLRMAILLFQNQGFFESRLDSFAWLLQHFPRDEWKWGLLAAVAAVFKGVGMFSLLFRRWDTAADAAFLLREIGWALSVVFWGSFGLSIQIGDAQSLQAILCGAIVWFSIGALTQGPAMPEASRGYEG